MINSLIIDGDGVAILRDKRFSDRLASEYGIMRDKTAPFFSDVFRDCTIGKKDLKKELERYYRSWGWKGTVDELLHFWFSKEGSHNKEMLAILTKLRSSGIKVYLATDNEKYRTDYIVNEFGYGKYFDSVFSSAYIGFRKEDAGFWEHLTIYKGVIPSETLVWDDEQENLDMSCKHGFTAERFTDMENFVRTMKNYFTRLL